MILITLSFHPLITLSFHPQGLEHLVQDRRHRQGHPVLPARRERYPQVLVVQVYPEPGGEVVLEEVPAPTFVNKLSVSAVRTSDFPLLKRTRR